MMRRPGLLNVAWAAVIVVCLASSAITSLTVRVAMAIVALVIAVGVIAPLEIRQRRSSPRAARPALHWQSLVPPTLLVVFLGAVVAAAFLGGVWAYVFGPIALAALLGIPVSLWRFLKRFGWPTSP